MFVGRIRSKETITVNVEADSLAAVRETLHRQLPAGFELISAPVRMSSGTTTLQAVGTFARRDGVREIEADDLPSLWAKVPEDWQMLSIRRI